MPVLRAFQESRARWQKARKRIRNPLNWQQFLGFKSLSLRH